MGFFKLIKENYIPPSRTGPLAHVHMGGISEKSSEIPPKQAGSLLVGIHYVFIVVSCKR